MKHCYTADMLFDYLKEMKEGGIKLHDVLICGETTKNVIKEEMYIAPSVQFRTLPAGHTNGSTWDAEQQLVITIGG